MWSSAHLAWTTDTFTCLDHVVGKALVQQDNEPKEIMKVLEQELQTTDHPPPQPLEEVR